MHLVANGIALVAILEKFVYPLCPIFRGWPCFGLWDVNKVTHVENYTTATPVTALIKVAMMVQKFVAGIGNLYASEILHRAKIHPETPAKSLKKKHTAKLQKFTLEILTEAIRYEGSTLGDGTYRNALNEAGGYQNAHRVYARAGKVCTSCQQTEILRIVQCQRSTFYCPACQPPV